MCILGIEHDKLFALANELLLLLVALLVRPIMLRDTHEESYRRMPPCVPVIPSLIPRFLMQVIGKANIVCRANSKLHVIIDFLCI
jgi:hypothetical protein